MLSPEIKPIMPHKRTEGKKRLEFLKIVSSWIIGRKVITPSFVVREENSGQFYKKKIDFPGNKINAGRKSLCLQN
jgi:hypothetical protein